MKPCFCVERLCVFLSCLVPPVVLLRVNHSVWIEGSSSSSSAVSATTNETGLNKRKTNSWHFSINYSLFLLYLCPLPRRRRRRRLSSSSSSRPLEVEVVVDCGHDHEHSQSGEHPKQFPTGDEHGGGFLFTFEGKRGVLLLLPPPQSFFILPLLLRLLLLQLSEADTGRSPISIKNTHYVFALILTFHSRREINSLRPSSSLQ